MLLSKTANAENSTHLPRIYYCAGTSDYDRCLETVAGDIFAHCKCAVWYKSDPAEPADRAALEEMQLVVIPITRALLTDADPVFEEEYSCISALHIPVLPILFEEVSTELYERKFGCIQYLNKLSADFTEISYSDKLKRYLDAVLISEELVEKIKAAFDAYIFVSYRKKDRASAKKLMRLIHENELCSSFATWYDEFLVPGEDYNQDIQSSLEKSDIFALVVTPNLLEEGNYISRCEYPAALELNKPILPFEAEKTDRLSLSERYERLPDCIGEEETEAFFNALMGSLGRFAAANRQSDTPQHTFFIGLAYMSGIDVETDKKRGVELITRAAEQGLPEAAERLADIYRTGDGVECSFETAAHWQKRLCSMNETMFETCPSEENLLRYTDSLYKLAELYELADDQTSAIIACERIINLLLPKCEEECTAELAARVLSAYLMESLLQTKRCHSTNALNAVKYALEFAEKYAEGIDEKALTNELIQLYTYMGDALMYDCDAQFADLRGSLYRFINNTKMRIKALDHYLRALQLLADIPLDINNTVSVSLEMVKIQTRLCGAYYKIGDFDKAEMLCRRAEGLIKPIFSALGRRRETDLYAAVCESYGTVYIFSGEPDKAREKLLAAVELRRSLAEEIAQENISGADNAALSEEYVNILVDEYIIALTCILIGEPTRAAEQLAQALAAYVGVTDKDCAESRRLYDIARNIKGRCGALDPADGGYPAAAAQMLSEALGDSGAKHYHYYTQRLRMLDARFFEISYLAMFLLAEGLVSEGCEDFRPMAGKAFAYLEGSEMISPFILNKRLRMDNAAAEPITSVMDYLMANANEEMEQTRSANIRFFIFERGQATSEEICEKFGVLEELLAEYLPEEVFIREERGGVKTYRCKPTED